MSWGWLWPSLHRRPSRLMKNAHLPFDRLMALSKVEGRRYPHSSALRFMYASLLGISGALHLDVFDQPA